MLKFLDILILVGFHMNINNEKSLQKYIKNDGINIASASKNYGIFF